MAIFNENSQQTGSSQTSLASSSDSSRVRSVATRLTEVEYGEVEAAANHARKKLAEWLRDAALAHARGRQEQTDLVLLAEIIGMRSLVLNLFAKALEGPISREDLQKMSAHAESMKEQRALDCIAQRRLNNDHKATGKD